MIQVTGAYAWGRDLNGSLRMDWRNNCEKLATSIGGFLDGMGLSVAAGLSWQTLAARIPGFQPLAPANILHLGGRLHPWEVNRFHEVGATVLKAGTIKQLGLDKALTPALDDLRSRTQRIHLHLDLDVLDPEEAPANEFAQPNGLSVEQVEAAIHLIGERFTISAGSVSAYDPDVDENGRTLEAGIRLIQAIVTS